MGNGDNDFVKKLVTYGGIIVISAAVGAAIANAILRDEEERPPIIVSNGTIELRPKYADQTNNDKGYWEQIGNSGKWRYRHPLTGPVDIDTEVYGGTCTGYKWNNGPLKVSYTDGTTVWVLEILVAGNNLQVDPQAGQGVLVDAGDKSHLTIGDPAVHTWITRLEPHGGSNSDYCTFKDGETPSIRLRQKR